MSSSWGAAPVAGRKRNHSHFTRDDDDMAGLTKRGNWVGEDPVSDSDATAEITAAAAGGVLNNSLGYNLGYNHHHRGNANYGGGVSGAGAAPASPPSQWRSALQNAIAAASAAAGREAAVRVDAEAALAHAQMCAHEALSSVRQEAERAAEESRLLKRAVGILSTRLEAAIAEGAALRGAAEEGRSATAALAAERAARVAAEDALRREAAARYATEVHLRAALDAAARGGGGGGF